MTEKLKKIKNIIVSFGKKKYKYELLKKKVLTPSICE